MWIFSIIRLLTIKKWWHTSKTKTLNQRRIKKNYETLNTVLESIDTIVDNGATSTSLNPSITGNGLFFLPISVGIAWVLSSGSKLLHKMIINI